MGNYLNLALCLLLIIGCACGIHEIDKIELKLLEEQALFEEQSAIYPVTGQVTNIEYHSGNYTPTTRVTLNSNEHYILNGIYEATIGDNITIFYTGTKYSPDWLIVVNN